MTPLEQRYATRNVPRYTSYPTAPHFHAGVTGEIYGEWLATLDPAIDLSLYLHVPYCRVICHYCGCHTKGARRDGPVLSYAEAMLDEITLVLERLGQGRRVTHIHWGGGTPSLLPRQQFLAIVDRLGAHFRFAESMEHAIELDPRTVTPALVRTLVESGITRASLGVQDFDPKVQAAIGRIQPYEVVARAVELLRDAGITALNFDLMYGLPHQTAETVLETVRRTLELSPGRIALFGYAHVPWLKKHQRLIDEAALPGARERMHLAALARGALTGSGYLAIGLDHFARADDEMAIALKERRLRRNFQGYTTDTARALIGFGASSIGFLPRGYVQNRADTGGWSRDIAAGRLPVAKGLQLSDDDRARAEIIERLMTEDTADVGEIAARYGRPLGDFEESLEAIGELVADGLAEVAGNRVRITEAGRPFVRIAAAAFDAYLARGTARHSVAV